MNALYLLGSFAGVALLVLLNLLLMGRARPRVDTAAASALLAAEHPGFRRGDAVVAEGGEAALLQDASDGGFYLVAAAGEALVSRRLAADGVAALTREGCALRLRLRDFTFPSATLVLADEEAAKQWEGRLARVLR